MTLAALEQDASATRPEARQTHLAADLAKVQADSARGTLLPQVSFHGAFEADRQQFINKGGANWLASIGLRWNLFNGGADKARIEESSHWMTRARADEQRVDSAVLESRTRYLAAVHDQRIAATMLELAAGRLSADSEVLNG